MLTYNLQKKPGLPLYEALYRCIREDILSGVLAAGQKLPSKRALAQNLEVSKITVEAAYDQLLSGGYIRSRERQGYFVEAVLRVHSPGPVPAEKAQVPAGEKSPFPFSVWSRLQRSVMLDYGQSLLSSMPNTGVMELRQAISDHLRAFRGMGVEPKNILVGAGSDFLYNLLIQLLGRDKVYGVEDPGYQKIRKIYAAGGVVCRSVAMDDKGVMPQALADAKVLHISPNHHFPSGLVTPRDRRQELLAWAEKEGGWIIEDDYDSEFRFDAHPMPAMQSMDPKRVIYMNSFSRSLASSIRISYMVLPGALMEKFQQELGFYSCTVPSFEQYTLARFLSLGHFEKHINRMRRLYRSRRNKILAAIAASPAGKKLTILEKDAGLHFLLKLDTALPDEALEQAMAAAGLSVPPLSRFYHGGSGDLHCLVVSYADFREDSLEKLLEILERLI